MYTFPELIKKIRDEADLNQADFATALGVSVGLIAMIETGQREVSKKFVSTLAEKLEVHPASITPFLYIDEKNPLAKRNPMERKLIQWGEDLQTLLITKKSKKLKKYAK